MVVFQSKLLDYQRQWDVSVQSGYNHGKFTPWLVGIVRLFANDFGGGATFNGRLNNMSICFLGVAHSL